MSAEYPCGKDSHKFHIWFKCERCGTEKEFTIDRMCQANEMSAVYHAPMELKKFACRRCGEMKHPLKMIFYCSEGAYDHDSKPYEPFNNSSLLLRVHIDNIDGVV